jgi:hypothetical protein
MSQRPILGKHSLKNKHIGPLYCIQLKTADLKKN